mmetsp:Transcript_124662/g.302759  ORF Transcript_124662/g.302759 Transcript_124662/m.302759 type:complete len:268 (-) Transcript_124662:109-912(-)
MSRLFFFPSHAGALFRRRRAPSASIGDAPTCLRSFTTSTWPMRVASWTGSSPRPVAAAALAPAERSAATTSTWPRAAATCRAVPPVPMPSRSAFVRTFTSAPAATAAWQVASSPLTAAWKSAAFVSSSTTPRDCFAFPALRFFLSSPASARPAGDCQGLITPAASSRARRSRQRWRSVLYDSGRTMPFGVTLRFSSPKIVGALFFARGLLPPPPCWSAEPLAGRLSVLTGPDGCSACSSLPPAASPLPSAGVAEVFGCGGSGYSDEA